MDPDKVMEYPVDIEALLEALFLFGLDPTVVSPGAI
jgi:hypothetical protein